MDEQDQELERQYRARLAIMDATICLRTLYQLNGIMDYNRQMVQDYLLPVYQYNPFFLKLDWEDAEAEQEKRKIIEAEQAATRG